MIFVFSRSPVSLSGEFAPNRQSVVVPGLNALESGEWEAIQKHPAASDLVEQEKLVELKPIEGTEGDRPSHYHSPEVLILGCHEVARLSAWRNAETDTLLKDLCNEQIDRLKTAGLAAPWTANGLDLRCQSFYSMLRQTLGLKDAADLTWFRDRQRAIA